MTPDVVFILVDNVGWGDFGVYGGTVPTPRIDKLASEGIRFNNYNVEVQCTPTRSAILTPCEGSMRVPAMIRWPGKVPAGVVTQEMLAAVDWLPTVAGMVGASNRVPKDRPIDGVDASAFMLGKSNTTGRDIYMFFGDDGGLLFI
jgi:arylsulfatase A-like enzyme